MDPFTVSAIAKGLGSVFGLFSNKKKNNAADAYANAAGRADTDYANAQTAYATGIQNQQANKDETSRVARENIRTSLLKSLGGPSAGTYGAGGSRAPIIDLGGLASQEERAQFKPIDYSGAPMRTYTPRPSSNTGAISSALSGLFDSVAAGANARGQSQDYDKALADYRFMLENPGVQQLPVSKVDYNKIFQSVFGPVPLGGR